MQTILCETIAHHFYLSAGWMDGWMAPPLAWELEPQPFFGEFQLHGRAPPENYLCNNSPGSDESTRQQRKHKASPRLAGSFCRRRRLVLVIILGCSSFTCRSTKLLITLVLYLARSSPPGWWFGFVNLTCMQLRNPLHSLHQPLPNQRMIP